MKNIWTSICNFFKRIINWFKNLFKKKKVVVYNGKEIVVEKPTLPIASACVDIFSSIVDSKSKSRKTKIQIIDKDINKLVNTLYDKTPEEVKTEIVVIENKIVTVKKEVKGSLKEDKVIAKEIKALDKRQKTLDSIKKVYEIDKKEEKKNKEDKKDNPLEYLIPSSKKIDVIDIKVEDKKEEIEEKKEIKEDKKEDKKVEVNKEENKDVKENKTPRMLLAYKEYVKYTNKVLKEGDKLLKDINNSNDYQLSKIKVEELKKKIIEIRKLYYDFKHSEYIFVLEQDFELKEIDKYEVLKNSEKIDYYLNKCNSVLQTMEYMNSHKEVMGNINIKKEVKKEEVKNSKREEKKEIKNEIKKDENAKIIQEIEEANRMIIKEVKVQQAELNKFLAKLETLPVPVRKTKRLGFFTSYLMATLRSGFGVFNIFRNRHLSALTHGYILNNRIRIMRRIINPNVDVECITFNRRIKNEIDIINNYQTICNDSLYQISSLKEEFLRYFGYKIDNPELKEAFTKLVELEDQITEQQQNLMNAKIKLNGKIKVKRFYN